MKTKKTLQEIYKRKNQYKKETYKKVACEIPLIDIETLAWLEINKPVGPYIYNLIKQDMKKSDK